MNQHFTVQKKAIFVRKKFLQRGSPKKKIPAQAVSEKKKNSCKLKILRRKSTKTSGVHLFYKRRTSIRAHKYIF